MTTYVCDDGNAEVEYEAESPGEAAQQYVDDGDWGTIEETSWVRVYVRPASDPDASPEVVSVALQPEVPDCDRYPRLHSDCTPADGGHDWHSPYDLVSGIKENPGVWGHSGGVVIKEVCADCGLYRHRDTWAQDPATGEQGLTSIKYDEADEASLAWLDELRVSWEALESMQPGQALVVGTATGCRCTITYVVTREGIDGDETEADNCDLFPDGWPEPSEALVAEAKELIDDQEPTP